MDDQIDVVELKNRNIRGTNEEIVCKGHLVSPITEAIHVEAQSVENSTNAEPLDKGYLKYELDEIRSGRNITLDKQEGDEPTNMNDISKNVAIDDEYNTEIVIGQIEEKKNSKMQQKGNRKDIATSFTNSDAVTSNASKQSFKLNDLSKSIKRSFSIKKLPKVEEMDPETVCGIGFFKPQWLQSLASPRTYLILFSILGVLQGLYYTYLIGILTTLEKRYAFKSKTSGVIMLMDELSPLVMGVFVGYFGGRTHRPRVVAIGMFMSALCCLISAFPYFIFGEAHNLMSAAVRNDTISAYCDAQEHEESCDVDNRPSTMSAIVCLIVGSFLKGFGNLAYYSIGIAYMDDTTNKKNTPLYFAITMSSRLLGPTFGFVMASTFLKYYENPTGDPGFGPKDPRWVGAWWLGFILQGALLMLFSFPMLLFPKRLPKQRTRAFSNTANIEQETMGDTLKGLLRALERLGKNKVYVLFCLGSIFSIISTYGYFITSTKYVENQFRLTASQASIISGPPSLVALILSTTAGGVVVWKWKPNAKKLVGAIIFTEIFGTLGYLSLMIPSCSNYVMAGTTQVNGQIHLTNECNSNCSCSTSSISPVCGPDGVSSYFSACHAGCSAMSFINDTEVFQNCSCIYNDDGFLIHVDKVENGFCVDESCWPQLMVYLVVVLCTSMLSNSLRVANKLVLLRCVEPEDKSVALGLFETLVCTFAFIPYPLLYGALVDSSCLVWESSCGETGNCWFYDVDRFKYLLHGASAAFAVLAGLCYFGVFLSADKIKDLYADSPKETLGE